MGLSQGQMAALISESIKGIDRALISKMETGLCEPSAELREWLRKACAQPSDEPNSITWVTLRDAEKRLLNGELQAQIYKALETSSFDYPVTRTVLRLRTGRSDRKIRKAIADMRQAGILIVASSSGQGYWLAQTDEDIAILRHEYTARLRACSKILRTIEAASPDQYVMVEVDGA